MSRLNQAHKIAILTHPNDNFESGIYLLKYLVGFWRRSGLKVQIFGETNELKPADILFLHVEPELLLMRVPSCRGNNFI